MENTSHQKSNQKCMYCSIAYELDVNLHIAIVLIRYLHTLDRVSLILVEEKQNI